MSECESNSGITCTIRCMDPALVDAALQQLHPAGFAWVPYTCQITNKAEEILLIGDELASRLSSSLPGVDDANGAKILAGLYSAELCECDVATLTRLPEDEVVGQLGRLLAAGTVAHREIHGMNYYRLNSELVRQSLGDAIS